MERKIVSQFVQIFKRIRNYVSQSERQSRKKVSIFSDGKIALGFGMKKREKERKEGEDSKRASG